MKDLHRHPGWHGRLSVAALVIAIVPGLTACTTENTPTAGQTVAQPVLIPDFRIVDPSLNPLDSETSRSDSKFLKAREGGELDVRGVKVRFQRSSLPEDMKVTLTLLDPELLSFRVEPAGLVLSRPAVVKTDRLNETNGQLRSGLRLLRKEDGTWSPQQSQRWGNRFWSEITVLGDYGLGFSTSDGQSVELIAWLDGAGYRTRLVRAERGGTVKYGRYEVTFPPEALTEDTYITVRDPGSGYVMCDLEPEGMRFNRAVDLDVDLKGTGITGDGWTIFWWNPLTGLWEDQEGVFSGDRVNANLWHFSTYAAGKAGW